jgi:site-specific DNA recombinase
MIAAIYARKSTEQNGVGDEEKSVARQIEHAKAYAAKKGWSVDDTHVYSDDGISGAEFKKRPGFLRLLNALSPRPPFQVLVMSEESRLGREAIETGYVLKQIMDAGVRVFFYLEDRERTLDTAMDKVMLSLTNFASEMEREKARQRTYDAMVRKAKALHVTGGKVYGYNNVDVPSPEENGTRLRVVRQINDEQAVTVRRVFELYASGVGMVKIAHRLNQEGVRPPRGRGWAPSGIREMLHRELYRGTVVWNRSQKIVRAGTKKQRKRDESEWIRIEAPELRIVSEDLWGRVKETLDTRAAIFPRGSDRKRALGTRMSPPTCSSGSPSAAHAAGRLGRTCAAGVRPAPGVPWRTMRAWIRSGAGRRSASIESLCGRICLTARFSARLGMLWTPPCSPLRSRRR